MKRPNTKYTSQGSSHGGDKDRYLITYADLITLLLGLFVILYASSQVDSEKFSEMSVALSKYFQSEPAKVLEGGEGVLPAARNGVPEPLLLPTSSKSIETVQQEASDALSDYIQKGLVSLRRSGNGIVIILPEKLLFAAGKAEIERAGAVVIDTLSSVLRAMKYSIMVDGHTDSTPIRTFQYESNWHLSVARATNVGYRMIRLGVPEENFILRGFGAQRPVKDNLTEAGRSNNRRVEITITQTDANSPAKLSDSSSKN